MVVRKKEGALTAHEKKIVKALLNDGWRNQDIQALVNAGRNATINSARITGVKQNQRQEPASSDEVEFYQIKKASFDPQTGLNLFDDERLIRSREAMVLAVQIFNSPALKFKSGVFSVLAHIAWTYLLHEFYDRKGVQILKQDGRTLLLSQMIRRQDSPLSDGIRNNLKALKLIRDDVEHKFLGKGDAKWLTLFQACCLNFEKTICELFGEELSLSTELGIALQFGRLNIDQISEQNKFEVPEHIEALDARIEEGLSDEQLADLEYQFRVIYTLDAASKSRAHIEFFRPDSAEGKEIRNVLVQHKIADQMYPHKPKKVVALVAEKSGKSFSMNLHTKAWRMLQVRPRKDARDPENTVKDYCIYHAAHGDYTYSDRWIEFLVEQTSDPDKLAQIDAFDLSEQRP